MIPFYSFKEIHQPIEKELIEKSSEIISSGNYVFGTAKFEEEFADYVDSKKCIGVSSGTSALHLALLSLGIKEGDEVITVSHTFRATVASILYCNAVPVYVDIDPETFTMDVSQIESKITERTKCIMPVHLYGNAAPIKEIIEIAKKHNLYVVEDCSQAHGTTVDGQHVGTFGDIGTFSFYPGKGLGALGDAGCVVTNNEDLAKWMSGARQWSDNVVGYNYRMSNLQAEFLRIKLKTFNNVLEEKRRIADEYNKHFQDVTCRNGVNHSYHIYPILNDDRSKLMESVKPKVDLKCHYPLPVHKLQGYADDISLPVTEKISSTQISLPIYPGVDYQGVIVALNDYLSTVL